MEFRANENKTASVGIGERARCNSRPYCYHYAAGSIFTGWAYPPKDSNKSCMVGMLRVTLISRRVDQKPPVIVTARTGIFLNLA